jgi:hypothetical protein
MVLYLLHERGHVRQWRLRGLRNCGTGGDKRK